MTSITAFIAFQDLFDLILITDDLMCKQHFTIVIGWGGDNLNYFICS